MNVLIYIATPILALNVLIYIVFANVLIYINFPEENAVKWRYQALLASLGELPGENQPGPFVGGYINIYCQPSLWAEYINIYQFSGENAE